VLADDFEVGNRLALQKIRYYKLNQKHYKYADDKRPAGVQVVVDKQSPYPVGTEPGVPEIINQRQRYRHNNRGQRNLEVLVRNTVIGIAVDFLFVSEKDYPDKQQYEVESENTAENPVEVKREFVTVHYKILTFIKLSE
jgi:hypothetical protein